MLFSFLAAFLQKFDFSFYLIDGERLFSVVVGLVRFLVNKPLDFHDATFSVSPSLVKSILTWLK